ncbi:MAG: hypothetical protein DMD91_26490 [Candidatus Rokuibacteriota bacterium]|nr:MAG: hypothetical protein DMD91_26490 [Candidatus Rokubacteria bacterium]
MGEGIVGAVLSVLVAATVALADEPTAETVVLSPTRYATNAETPFRLNLLKARQAAAAAPEDAMLHVRHGDWANAIADFEEALVAYREAVRLEPTPERRMKLGLVAAGIGRVEEAVAALRLAAGAEWSRRGEVAERLLLVHLDAGDRAGAEALARQQGWLTWDRQDCRVPLPSASPLTARLMALFTQPDWSECLVDAAMTLTDWGYARLGHRLMNEAIARTDNDWLRERAAAFLRMRLPVHEVPILAESLNGVGIRLARSGQDTDAIAVYERALAVDPQFSWALNNLGQAYAKRGDDAQALECYRRAVAVNPSHLRAWRNVGNAATRLKRYDEAIEAYQRALTLDPDDGRTHADHGSALYKAGRRTEGIQAMQRGLRLDPGLKDFREFLDRELGQDTRTGPTPFSVR